MATLQDTVKGSMVSELQKDKSEGLLMRPNEDKAQRSVSASDIELTMNENAPYVNLKSLDSNVFRANNVEGPSSGNLRTLKLLEIQNIAVEAQVAAPVLESLFGVKVDVQLFGGPQNLVKMNELKNIPELSYIFRPATGSESEGEANFTKVYNVLYGDLLIPRSGAERLIDYSLSFMESTKNPEYDQVRKSFVLEQNKIDEAQKSVEQAIATVLEQNPGMTREEVIAASPELQGAIEQIELASAELAEDIEAFNEEVQSNKSLVENKRQAMLAALDSCGYVTRTLSSGFFEEVVIVGESDGGGLDSTLERYLGDAIETRRPAGSFFVVDMVDLEDKRQYVKGAQGQLVTGLILNMKPDTLSVNSANIINRHQSLTRWVEENWGADMDQVSFSGSTFAFISFDNGRGLTVHDRQMTVPYKELRHLAGIFQTNGIQYQEGPIVVPRTSGLISGTQRVESYTTTLEPRTFFTTSHASNVVRILRHPRAGMVKTRYRVRITHDWFRAWGAFDSFDVVEDTSSSFRLTYSCNFTAEKVLWL